MGQHLSRQQQEKYGSIIIGYTSIAPAVENPNLNSKRIEDRLLSRPFVYGLSAVNDIHSSSKRLNKRDSGFLMQQKDSRLWKDLFYIDQTYYCKNQGIILSIESNLTENLVFGDALTWNDLIIKNRSTIINFISSKVGLKYLSPNIGLLTMIRKLDLSFNQLKELPDEIGYLNQLEVLQLSHNQIDALPDTICYLSKLIELNASHNQIEQLTPYIGYLGKLKTLDLEHNQLKEITICFEKMIKLNTINLSHNPIMGIPIEIIQLPSLLRLGVDGCSFSNTLGNISLAHNPPSLLETCARSIIKNGNILFEHDNIRSNSLQNLLKSYLTEPLFNYLTRSKTCSFCYGPYFDSCVLRVRWIEKNGTWIPLEYRLCSAHWSSEEDRLCAVFSSPTPKKIDNRWMAFLESKPKLMPIDPSMINQHTKPLIPAIINMRSSIITTERGSIIDTVTDIGHDLEPVEAVVDNLEISNISDTVGSSSVTKRWKYEVGKSSFLSKKRNALYF